MSDQFEDQYTVEILEPLPPEGEGVRLEDFFAYKPTHEYIWAVTGKPWVTISIDRTFDRVPVLGPNGLPMQRNGRPVTMLASEWLDKNQSVEAMAWAPGEPKLIEGRLLLENGWKYRKDVRTYNIYQPPQIKLGNADEAWPWVNHVHTIYKDDAHHIIPWLAHRVQRPGEKINHALVLGGMQGVGKDSLLSPVRIAVGVWNFHDVRPDALFGAQNGWAKAVILRISEAHDLSGENRFKFYDRTKSYGAAPPEALEINLKYVPQYYAFNCVGLIITTNHKTDGIYLPADDRRHYVAWSDRTKEEFPEGYFNELHTFYDEGGTGHVAAYLMELDISDFDPKAPPPKTAAFHAIVNVNQAPEDAELADVIDAMGNPDAVTLAMLQAKATGETAIWLMDRKNRRVIPHRLERCG
jgi:hypothetical protein